uniref:Uncharacterized protein n=1 Tax=Globisporangium ultimum (strain ATCC 200006 / CBS 805.95 / DAOM BR144) TaxID=431595 RepID=K3WTE7_GLOUD
CCVRFLNLPSTIIKSGILSLPYAYDKCDLVLAFVFNIVSSMVSNFSLYLTESCGRFTRRSDDV